MELVFKNYNVEADDIESTYEEMVCGIGDRFCF